MIEPPIHQPLSARVFAGTLVGFFGAVALALVGAIALAIAVLADPSSLKTSFDAAIPLGLGLYVMGGAVSGAVGGVLFPLARRRLGAAIVGMAVGQPFIWACGAAVAMSDPMTLGEAAFIAGGMTLIFGPIIGLAWIRPLHKP